MALHKSEAALCAHDVGTGLPSAGGLLPPVHESPTPVWTSL